MIRNKLHKNSEVVCKNIKLTRTTQSRTTYKGISNSTPVCNSLKDKTVNPYTVTRTYREVQTQNMGLTIRTRPWYVTDLPETQWTWRLWPDNWNPRQLRGRRIHLRCCWWWYGLYYYILPVGYCGNFLLPPTKKKKKHRTADTHWQWNKQPS